MDITEKLKPKRMVQLKETALDLILHVAGIAQGGYTTYAIFFKNGLGSTIESYLDNPIVPSLALGGFVAGELLAAYGIVKTYLLNKGEYGNIYEPGKNLISDGVYAIIRHPTYLGFRMMSIGFLAYNPTVENLLLTASVFFSTEGLARLEESEMKRNNLNGHSEYLSKVPRWLPSLRKTVLKLKKSKSPI